MFLRKLLTSGSNRSLSVKRGQTYGSGATGLKINLSPSSTFS